MAEVLTQRQKLLGEVYRTLGGGIVRVELTPEHLDDALNFALETYRQRSSHSTEERVAFLDVVPGQNVYILPSEIIEVRQVFRRGTSGTTSGTGSNFEPFGAAFVNQTAMGLSSGGGQGKLVTFELMAGFQELVGRMFGAYINFTWHAEAHRIELVRDIRSPETMLLWVYNYRPEEYLLNDLYARPWLKRFTIAQSKLVLGEARSKFGSVAGPQGGTTLNGDALIQQGQTEIDNLHIELANQLEQSMGYGFIIG
jgi:hypothetical protein